MQVGKQAFKDASTDAHLCHTNMRRKEVNKTMMQKAAKRTTQTPLCIKGLPYDSNSQDVQLLPGMPVICRKTCAALDICNNEMFTVQALGQETVTVTNEYHEVDIPLKEFQKLFYVAYAITIRKSQGQTYNKPYTIHEWDKLDRRLRYVALSRATHKELINII
jgi:ATP-dependent exoDNAse (exonuclease V) alpha subunit